MTLSRMDMLYRLWEEGREAEVSDYLTAEDKAYLRHLEAAHNAARPEDRKEEQQHED